MATKTLYVNSLRGDGMELITRMRETRHRQPSLEGYGNRSENDEATAFAI